MRPLKPGWWRIPAAVYHDDPCAAPSLSRSTALRLVAESPAKAWAYHPRGGGLVEPHTAATKRGAAIEALLGLSTAKLVSLPDEMPDAKGDMKPTNGEFRMASTKAWRLEQEQAGNQVVGADELSEWTTAAEAIAEKLAKRGVVFNGESQVTVVWEEPGGVIARGCLDHWWADYAVIRDLKICESVHPDALAAKFEQYGYDIQRAAYVRGVEALTSGLAGHVKFEFIFAEPEPPYEVVICEPDGEMRALGDFKWRRAVQLWGSCLAAKKFPGYADDRVLRIAPKPWSMAKAMEGGFDVAAAA